MELYFIRHGECLPSTQKWFDEEKRTMNPPLTERGRRQAEQMAKYLKDISFDEVYCSDLLRARQTAEALTRATDVELIIDRALREIDFGDLFQRSWRDFPELFTQWSKHEEDMPYPNGENGSMVWKRCEPLIRKIIS